MAAVAELLETDVDTLLIAAAEERIDTYWLLNRIVHAEFGLYDGVEYEDPDAPPWEWFPEQEEPFKRFTFVPLLSEEAAELLKANSVNPKGSRLSDFDEQGRSWRPLGGWLAPNIEGAGPIGRDGVYLKREDVERIQSHGLAEKQRGRWPEGTPKSPGRQHWSDDLMKMIQAARKFWELASPDDPTSQASNDEVAAWLEQQGMTRSRAERAASLIRPSWAHNGRKPES